MLPQRKNFNLRKKRQNLVQLPKLKSVADLSDTDGFIFFALPRVDPEYSTAAMKFPHWYAGLNNSAKGKTEWLVRSKT